MNSESVDVAALTRQAVNEISGQAFSRQIRFSLALPDQASAVADGAALKRALGNLLTNALQYTRNGGLVRIEIRMADKSLLMTLQDNGLGFSAAERAIAGQPFVSFRRPGMHTGTGLGLAIAGSLIRRMGGALNVSGKPGEGAKVEIRLRRA